MLTPQKVAEQHITAVLRGDPVLMAADYASDAVLIRGDDIYYGKNEILDYFKSVPERLGNDKLEFLSFNVAGDKATFAWQIVGDTIKASGQDVLIISNGLIIEQKVFLSDSDF
jgi:hypothetical protein